MKNTKTCKHCKEQFSPYNSLQKYCFKPECTKVFVEIEKAKQWRKKKSQLKTELYPDKPKQYLQNEINKLARIIDAKFGYVTCIDCDKKFGKQIDGGHFISVGANASLRYNLHNIHSQASNCNQNGIGGGKQLGYRRGLEIRYGEEYANYLEFEQSLKYPLIKLTNEDITSKLKTVRSIIRDFDTYQLDNSRQARELFNKLIGIYI